MISVALKNLVIESAFEMQVSLERLLSLFFENLIHLVAGMQKTVFRIIDHLVSPRVITIILIIMIII